MGDVKDDRKAKSTGFDIIYEARDLDLPQNVRDGLTQARSSVDDTKKRVAESKKRITQEVLPYIKKAYWTKAKAGKKAALAAKKQFFNEIERVDFAIREKKMEAALEAYDTYDRKLSPQGSKWVGTI